MHQHGDAVTHRKGVGLDVGSEQDSSTGLTLVSLFLNTHIHSESMMRRENTGHRGGRSLVTTEAEGTKRP